MGGKRHTRHIIHTNLMVALCASQLIFVFGIEATENKVKLLNTFNIVDIKHKPFYSHG